MEEEYKDNHSYRVLRTLGGSHEIIGFDEVEESWVFQWAPMAETDTLDQLREQIDLMRTALDKPIIEHEVLWRCKEADCTCHHDVKNFEAGRQAERERTQHILMEVIRWIRDIEKQDVSSDTWKAEMNWLCDDIQEILDDNIAEDNSLAPKTGDDSLK